MDRLRKVVPWLACLTFLTPGMLLAAVPPAQASPSTDLVPAARAAVRTALPGLAFRQRADLSSRSLLDGGQQVGVTTAVFGTGNRAVQVVRAVGADRKVTVRNTVNGRVLRTLALHRRGAGERTAVLSTTATTSPGLKILAWTERPGVNYQLIARGPVTQQELVKLAAALPKDAVTVSSKVRTIVANAKPLAASSVDRNIKQPQAPDKVSVTPFGITNGVVDGAGTTLDDLNNEATLCNGCSYSNSNYVGLWQNFLYADNKLAFSAIDCVFGSGTASATRSWQSSKGLGSDGVVGPVTRNYADDSLVAMGGGNVQYWGTTRFIFLVRGVNPDYYYFSNGTRVSYGRSGSPPGC